MRTSAFAFLSVLLLAACSGNSTYLLVTVDALGPIHGVANLDVTVQNGGQKSQKVTVLLHGAPVDLPPAQTFALRLPGDRAGNATVNVTANGVTTLNLAVGSWSGTLEPGKVLPITIKLGGNGPPADMGADGMTNIEDAAPIDLSESTDGTILDLAATIDITRTVDATLDGVKSIDNDDAFPDDLTGTSDDAAPDLAP